MPKSSNGTHRYDMWVSRGKMARAKVSLVAHEQSQSCAVGDNVGRIAEAGLRGNCCDSRRESL